MIEIKNLHKAFNGSIVLDGVSFTVEEAENMVVFGRSGTGKSVLLKCMIRLMEADSGNVIIKGQDVSKLKLKELNELRKDIEYVFKDAGIYDFM